MNTNTINWKKILGILTGISALYFGKEIFKNSYFFLGGAIYASPFYFIFVSFCIIYIYMIIGLIRLKKWAWYLFGSTVFLALVFIVRSINEIPNNIGNAIFLAMSIVWPWVCITILPLIIVITMAIRIRNSKKKEK